LADLYQFSTTSQTSQQVVFHETLGAKMADVEMIDSAAAAPKGKKVAAAAGDTDGKKRFEVKKVDSRGRTCTLHVEVTGLTPL
jgi:hypothetical protein